MITVLVSKEKNFPVGSSKIKWALKDFFKKNGIVSDAFVNVSFVDNKKMIEVSSKYLKDKKVHNVLSFTNEDKANFVFPPGAIYLGDIVLCFPELLKEAKNEGKLIDEKAIELCLHAGEHLLGRHHE